MATYSKSDKEFEAKYAKEIAGIATANKVDLSTGKEMFKSNLDNAGKGVKAYKGGGVATNWDEMVSDYKNLKTTATNEVKSSKKKVTNASGREVNVSDLLPSGSGYGKTSGTGVSNSSGGVVSGGQLSQMGGSGQTSGSSGGTGGSSINDFYKNSADAFLANQKATFDKQLSQQLTDLESSYAQAISEGKISVRDAEAQFLEQKASIEQEAYKQFEATKAYSNEMGISNSQQALGLQQGDNARVRSTNNANLTDRDKRIADITDRISTLGLQKNLATTQANADYGYNMAGANAQASQMYNQSMGGFMQEDYFSDKTQANAEKNMAIGQGYNKENMAIQQGYNKENMGIEQGYRKELSEFQNTLDISKMWVGHDINLKELDAQLENQFKIIDKNFGIDRAMEGIRNSNQMKQISASARASAKSVTDEYQIAMDREARRLGLPPGYNEKTISDALKAEGKQALVDEMNMKRDAGIKDSIAQAGVQREMEILQNPNRYINPKAPKDYTANQPLGGFDPVGNVLNLFTGYGKDTKTYKEQLAIKTEAENKAKAIELKYNELYGK